MKKTIEIEGLVNSMEQISVGQHLMVVKGPIVKVRRREDSWTGQVVEAHTTRDDSSRGTVLKVMAVDLPYIVAKIPGYKPRVIDLAAGMQFKVLSDAFVEALLETKIGVIKKGTPVSQNPCGTLTVHIDDPQFGLSPGQDDDED